jgi:hypothetical protein
VRFVPIVALVPEATARRIEEITRAREAHVGDDEAMATLRSLAAQHGWTMEMLVAGRYLATALPDGGPVAP